ncbi:glycoside hydrolase family 3 N-terminal domain-containing protein [Algibacter mikhailovii]|uniref:Glycosyl hydrolase family 3 n=1 Tax=Algibacter mikhailovii TaxID=425498 RepID=A0A918R519_9FLAO|nr:glycoside hydrolase family 3 N-terminal domain-containing protein [Algibacter mikhailovii]GGZ86031.1 glycosyl hydrolase family 3 [Algibacter mikhailovii]
MKIIKFLCSCLIATCFNCQDFAIKSSSLENALYKDPSQPVEKRVKDLIGRMTLEEKVAQMHQVTLNGLVLNKNGKVNDDDIETLFKGIGSGTVESPFLNYADVATISEATDRYLRNKTRLGIPAIQIAEGLHGYLAFDTTIFPQAIALGSTWEPELIKQMSAVVAKEASASGVDQALSPVFDVIRDPRWGRTEESYSEDPYLVSKMGVAFVNGLQGEKEITKNGIPEGKLMATVKHFGAYSAPLGGINLGVVSLGERELRNTHYYPVKKAIDDANVYVVMPSYNELDGVPIHANKKILRDVLRDELGFKGYTFSDYEAIDMLTSYFHNVAKTRDEAGIMALKGGTDLEAPGAMTYKNLVTLVKEGRLEESLINQAVSRILTAKFKAGLFERPYSKPEKIEEIVHTYEAIKLSRTLAEESIILLKNENNLLPLDQTKIKSIAVIGPNADQIQYGDYSATKNKATGVTILEGIKSLVGKNVKVNYAKGTHISKLDKSGIVAAVTAARESDVVVLAIGGTHKVLGGVGWEGPKSSFEVDDETLNPPTGGEGYDRTSLRPPGVQSELIKAIHATGKPIVLVMVHGRPYSIVWENENLPAIVETWYNGEQGGNAIADVLFGNVNPSGKLTLSVPRTVGQIPVFYNHQPSHRGFYGKPGTIKAPGRDYVFETPVPLFEFGYGLSYTTFEYRNLKLDKNSYSVNDDLIKVSFELTNNGAYDGKEVVQLYYNDIYSSVATPVKILKGFKKIHLKKGETKTVDLELSIQEMGLWNTEMKYVVEPGEFNIMIGASSNDIRLNERIDIKL